MPGDGGNFAIRLGDDVAAAETAAIVRTFTVSATSPKIHYDYALVLEDPGHPAYEQPYFRTKVWIGTSLVHDFEKISASSDPFFRTTSKHVIPLWSCDIIDLSAHVGQTATIQIEVADRSANVLPSPSGSHPRKLAEVCRCAVSPSSRSSSASLSPGRCSPRLR